MAQTYKVLGQVAPAATTDTPLYTVPGAASAVVSTVVICNRSATPTTFRLRVAIAGAAVANAQYLVFDVMIAASMTLTLGLTLGAGDVLSCYVNDATVSFNAFGSEIT